MARTQVAHYADCEIHGAAITISSCGSKNGRPLWFCTECNDTAPSLGISGRGGELSNIRSITLRPNHSGHSHKCDGSCLNGKHSCDCKCHGRCHGAGTCMCGN